MTWRKREIMDMAREAGIRDCTCSGEFGCLEAFAKLVREDALAQPAPVQEPIAHIPSDALEQLRPPRLILRNVPLYGYSAEGTVAVYTTPSQRTEQEPSVLIPASLAETQFERYYRQGYDAGFAAQRTWVGLTDEEAEKCRRGTWQATYQAIDALLREKNGGKA